MSSPAESDPAPRRNQRRCRRQVAKNSTKTRAYPNALGLGPNIAYSVLDVSESGARLILNRDMPVRAEFEINFESLATRPVKLLAVVVWSVPTADGRFVVGVRFEKSMPYAALQLLARP